MMTVIGAEVVVFPATSVATAVSVWVPTALLFGVQVRVYGVDVSVPNEFPSRRNRTLAIPEGVPGDVPRSVAVAVRVILVPLLNELLFDGAVSETVGAAASIRTDCVFTPSFLPATSLEKNLTVDVEAIVNGPV